VLTVGDLTVRIRQYLEAGFHTLAVRGEISNLRRQASGHIYFTLKDDRSQIPAVLFRGNALRVELELRDGLEVICLGNLTVYEPRGAYQLRVIDVHEEGLGQLQKAFEKLKAKLAAEGLFDEGRKRKLPQFPQTIGIVTSATGAALRDFIRILERRGFMGRILVFPALVQGSTAAASLIDALDQAARHESLDLAVIARGGGSLEDLWPFNEEAVVRKVAAFPHPIVSAVGHEIDFALTDFAADVRAETPSAAAELISSLWLETVRRMLLARETLVERADFILKRKGQDLDYIQFQLQSLTPELKVQRWRHQLSGLSERLRYGLSETLRIQWEEVGKQARRLERHYPGHRMDLYRQRLKSLEGRLKNASVESTLKRGFALVRDEQGRPVMARKGLQEGDRIHVGFRDGAILSEVLNWEE